MTDDRLRLVDGPDEVDDEVVRGRLAPFTAATQRYMDGELARRGARPVPPLRLNSHPRRIVWVAAAIVAVAALALLVVAPRISNETGRAPDPNAASHAEQPKDRGSTAVTPPVEPPPPPVVLDEPTLESLDDKAQRQWRAGDLDGAARTFRQMTRHGGDHRYVELAYGDMVSLARQRGRVDQTHVLWREYLQRFPRGRFSANARASVCGLSQAPSACSEGTGAR